MTPYTSDVRQMTDEELEVLSEELHEAYYSSGGGDEDDFYDHGYWTDDAAETRYDEMQAEIYRRWEIANPEEAERRRHLKANPPLFVKIDLERFAESLLFAREMNRAAENDLLHAKIGDTVTVQMPARFRA